MELLPEVEVWYMLPAIRRKLAQTLIAKGLTQKDVAEKLSIAPSAVSQYVSGKRGASDLPASLDQEFSQSADAIIAGGRDEMVREVLRLSEHLKNTRVVCEVHKQHSSEVPEGCSTCFD